MAREVEQLTGETGRVPGLATILVGDDPASAIYVANKRKACAEVGIADLHRHLAADADQAEVAAVIETCNRDPDTTGILLQLPVPKGLDGKALTALIAPEKDVDGLTPISSAARAGFAGPATVYAAGRDRAPRHLRGRARGSRGGRRRPLGSRRKAARRAAPAAQRDASRCATPGRGISRASALVRDVLVAAVGSPRLVGADHIKPGAAVIDVGTNRTDEGLVGDVDFEAALERARLVTPVPGGVGPMTIAMLLRNTVSAALLQR